MARFADWSAAPHFGLPANPPLRAHTAWARCPTSYDDMDATDKMLGGRPAGRDPKDEKIFGDEAPEGMEKMQQMDTSKAKRMEKREEELKADLKKEKRRVNQYAKEEESLQEDVKELRQDAKQMKSRGSDEIEEEGKDTEADEEEPKGTHEEEPEKEEGEEDHGHHEYFAQSRIVAPDYFEPTTPEDEIPVAVATTQDQWRRQKIAKDQIQVAQDQMQLAKDSQILAEGQDKLTNLRTPGMMKEELLAQQVRDQKRIALDQELLLQSQKRLAEDMDQAVDGKLRWERLENYRKKRIEQFQDMVNDKLDRLYKAEIDFVKRNGKGKLRGSPINIPQVGPVGVRVVQGKEAKMATGGNDGGEVLSEVGSPEEAAEKEAEEEVEEPKAAAVDQPVVHSVLPALCPAWAERCRQRRGRAAEFLAARPLA
ncbi:unnamed protein product [Effrenium voratum]|nr:unnamed protein product [Effrenium voratum]